MIPFIFIIFKDDDDLFQVVSSITTNTQRCACHTDRQESTQKGIHPGFETQGKHHQKSKTGEGGISGPTKKD